MLRAKHKWGEPERPNEHLTIVVCLQCGLFAHRRHEGNEHWIEFKAPWGGTVVECAPGKGPVTPRCDDDWERTACPT